MIARERETGRSSRCANCDAPVSLLAEAKVLGSIPAKYFHCVACGFVQTEAPHWLEQAYQRPIGSTDIGLVSRNEALAPRVKSIIEAFFNPRGRFLDYGGGYGLLVRMMRDRGYDFLRQDAYCQNVFAQGHDVSEATPGPFELVCAFEVLEHLVSPRDELQRMLAMAPAVLVSTMLIAEPPPLPGDWWYYALEDGQHVSLFSERALHQLAAGLGVHVATAGDLHLFSRKPVNSRLFRFVSRRRVSRALSLLRRRPSLHEADYAAAVARTQSAKR